MHFSEIIKLQFGKNVIHCFVIYRSLELLLLLKLWNKKMRGYPQFPFWTRKDYIWSLKFNAKGVSVSV